VSSPTQPMNALKADLGNGRLSVTFGADPASGSAYMSVHANN
jgi:hypothetical protein